MGKKFSDKAMESACGKPLRNLKKMSERETPILKVMQIDLSDVDREQFSVKEGVFADKVAFLVTHAIQGCEWTLDNLHFRSSIWDENGELKSASFPKFVNAGEKPDLFPVPDSLHNSTIVTKLDGSTCICDYSNNQYICRSRGTFDAQNLDNGVEFYQIFEKHPRIKDWLKDNPNYTLLAEICTPNNRIVIYYPELEFYLIGAVNKENYSLLNQRQLDILGSALLMKRPETYSFDSVPELVESVKGWKSQEGVVWETATGYLLKVKAADYLLRHGFMSNLSIKHLLELFLDQDQPKKEVFLQFIEDNFDHECRIISEDLVRQLEVAREKLDADIKRTVKFVELRQKFDRKDFAIEARHNLGDLAGIAFRMLDKKELDKATYKKLYYKLLNL